MGRREPGRPERLLQPYLAKKTRPGAGKGIMPELKVYSTDWCGDCRTLKRFLAAEGIAYTEINIEHDQAAEQELIERTGKRGIPYMVVEGDWIRGYPLDTGGFREILRGKGLL